MNDTFRNLADALADVFTLYAKQMTSKQDSAATAKLLQGIGDGSERVAIVCTLVPFSVAAMRLDDDGQPGDELFTIKNGDLH